MLIRSKRPLWVVYGLVRRTIVAHRSIAATCDRVRPEADIRSERSRRATRLTAGCLVNRKQDADVISSRASDKAGCFVA
jgi:hypothetical protein